MPVLPAGSLGHTEREAIQHGLQVGHLFGGFAVAATLDVDRVGGVGDLGEVVGGELHIGGADVLLESMQLAGPRHRHDPWLLREQPGQRDLPRVAPLRSAML
jgi:hypothetical protein